MNDLFTQWQSDGLPVQLIGIGKDSHMSSLGNWTNSNNAPVCADTSPFSVWSNWGVSQRDLVVLDHEGNVVLDQNISSGIPSNLESLVESLVSNINDCDSSLACPEVLTCCDGLLYPTGCCSDNCDEPIEDVDNICGSDCDSNLACPGVLTCCDGLLYPTGCCSDNCDEPIEDFYNICSEPECEDGEFDNANPCNPMECFDGQWFEIVIDCAEQMGVPCDGGVYVDPLEGVCCSTCIQYGDSNSDGAINVLDVVLLVNLVLSNEYNELVDMNSDNNLNVLDVVVLIDLIIG